MDMCGKLKEGQSCLNDMFCEEGLTCHPVFFNLGMGKCYPPRTTLHVAAKRDVMTTVSTPRTTTHPPRTLCEKTRAVRLLWNVTWKGMWIPKCDENGQFMEMQCDNIGQCFCVDPDSGKVDELTKRKGPVMCW